MEEEENVEEEEEEDNEPVEEIAFTAKIVMAGGSGVGKTSLINRAFENTFKADIKPTVGTGFRKGTLRKKGKKITMEVWDTAGQEQFNALAPVFFTNAAAAILVYDITDATTFGMLKTYVQMVHDRANQNCVIGIVGNKVDLVSGNESKRQVALKEAESYADSIGASFFLEASAKTGVSVDSIFELIAEDPDLQSKGRPMNLDVTENSSKKQKGCKC
ncbi:Ras-related protein RHN1 [Tritrichomonas foetus]|uniref:Ras-related protein RHN1 n=1 Tax=Tritrichomonas foetus TaxID=1144522 RepID=A0A1J4K6C6_9EUKA|nr:Ras-related protein RHN1 [Tritrichomonas foetus]|eukprot:OHT06723.1 Ras-related protein RHN1 [Tritrichomonas foetus]